MLVLVASISLALPGVARAATNPDQASDPVRDHCLQVLTTKADPACSDNGRQYIIYARNAAAYACADQPDRASATKCVIKWADSYIDDAAQAAKNKSKNYSAHDFEVALRQRLDKENVNYTDSNAASAANTNLGATPTDTASCSNGNCIDPAADPNCTGSKCDFIKKYVNPAINLLSISFGLIAAASIIFGGIQYSTAGGDPQKVSQAKQRIAKTLIAVVAYFFLYAFLQFIVPGGIFSRS